MNTTIVTTPVMRDRGDGRAEVTRVVLGIVEQLDGVGYHWSCGRAEPCGPIERIEGTIGLALQELGRHIDQQHPEWER